MARNLAGKKWFHAKGQSDSAKKMPKHPASRNQKPGCWPEWAKTAYLHGWYNL